MQGNGVVYSCGVHDHNCGILAWAWSLVEEGSNVDWWEGGENRLFIFFHEH
jgi:hypothetical protein